MEWEIAKVESRFHPVVTMDSVSEQVDRAPTLEAR
jgi:hypothetical protein